MGKQLTTRPKRRSRLGRDVDNLLSEMAFQESSQPPQSPVNLPPLLTDLNFESSDDKQSGKQGSVDDVLSEMLVEDPIKKGLVTNSEPQLTEDELALHSTFADLQRQLREESEKRLALAALVNSNSSEINDIKKALDAEVKARCVQIERLPSQQSSALEAAPIQNEASDICYVSLSTKALKDVIDSERLDRKQADEALLTTISCRLDRENSEREQTNQAHFQELNALFDEHLQNYFKEKNEGEEIRVNSSNSSPKGRIVTACVQEKIEKLMNKGNQKNTSLCKKHLSMRVAVVIALLAVIALAQRCAWLPKSLRLRSRGSKR